MVTGKPHKPTRFTRFVLYPLTTLFFLAILTVVLTLANGYRFTYTDGKVGLTKTGMLIVTTRPLDAAITLNGKLTKHKTSFYLLPTKISSLKPGKYDVVITKKGYRTWQDSLEIKPNMVTWANYILLFAEKLNIAKIDTPAGSVIAKSENGRHALFANTEGTFALKSLDTNNLSVRDFWPTTAPAETWLAAPRVISAEYSPNSELALLRITNGARTEYVVADASANPVKLIHLNTTLKQDFVNAWWNTAGNSEIYLQTASGINLAKIDATSLPAPILTEAISFKVNDAKNLLFVAKTPTGTYAVDRTNLDGSNRTTLVGSVVAAKNYQLSYTQKNDIVTVLNVDTGDLTTYYIGNTKKKTATVLSGGVTAFNWSKNGEYLYYYGRDFVKRFDTLKNRESDTYLADVPDSVHWYFDENHYIVTNAKGVFVMDLDGSNIVPIVEEKPVVAIHDTGNSNILFAIKDAAGKSVFSKYFSEF